MVSETNATSRGPYVGRLDDMRKLRQEAAKLYRAARTNAGATITPAEASLLARVLSVCRHALEAERLDALERRLAAVEESMAIPPSRRSA